MSRSSPATEDHPPFLHAVLIVNPTSGRGQGVKTGSELSEGLRTLGVRTSVYVTKERGDGLRHLRGLGESFDLALAVGGDGTLREVLEGLVDRETPVGIVPTGTANVLAEYLGLPRDVHHALEIIVRARRRALDVATVNGRLSFLCVGVGFDGWAVHDLESRRTGAITKWSYARPLLRALALHQPRSIAVTLDGETTRERFGSVLISNIGRYAGAIKLDPGSRMDDGALEVYLFPTARRAELVTALARGVIAHLPGGAVSMRRASRIRIEADGEVPCQVDGDSAGTTPVEVALAPTQYQLIVP